MTTKAKSLVIKPDLFRRGNPRLGVSKHWLTNNHWVVRKDLLCREDQLTFMTTESTKAWLTVALASTSHFDVPLTMTDGHITKVVASWADKGTRRKAPEPEPGVYQYKKHPHTKLFILDKSFVGKLAPLGFCVHSSYYKHLEPFLTHILYSSSAVGDEWTDAASLCNKDMTCFLRPFRTSPLDDMVQVHK